MTAPAAPATGVAVHRAWIDVAKGVAILAIVYFHLCGEVGAPYAFGTQAGVDTFLILSGFGLTVSPMSGGFREFFARRLFRLLPAYWLVLVAVVLLNLIAFHSRISWPDVGLHLVCAHLLGGEHPAFALVTAWWFMGLIVPLYVVYFPLRGRLRGTDGVVWALGFCAAMAVLGWWVLHYGAGWGRAPQIHSAGRFVSFATGCLLGSVTVAGPVAALRALQSPCAAAALGVWGAVAVFADGADLIGYPFAGLALMCVGVAVASSPPLRWLAVMLGGLGAISFEVYLIHQYLLHDIATHVVSPMLVQWDYFATAQATWLAVASALIALVPAGGIAWGVNRLVRGLASRSSVPSPAVGAAGLTAVCVVALGGWLLARQPTAPSTLAPSAQRYALVIEHVAPGPGEWREPLCYWGTRERADLLFLEHGADGRVRLGFDHWGTRSVTGPWFEVGGIERAALNIHRDRRTLVVSRGIAVIVASPLPPHAPEAAGRIGRNDIGFSLCAATATSRFRLEPHH
ncbi:MAG: acyltransferase [Verrucomicrobia bacterium]|nr:acyltransferase [Verrucomicrobiota bacterium]